MDFEDQLRKAANRIDYSDRDRLLRETARKSVKEFKELCLLKAQMGEHIFLKLSEADTFLEYIREEFRAQDMQSARADLEEDISSVPKRGLFGKVRRVSNNRYKVIMSMGW